MNSVVRSWNNLQYPLRERERERINTKPIITNKG